MRAILVNLLPDFSGHKTSVATLTRVLKELLNRLRDAVHNTNKFMLQALAKHYS